MPASNLRGDDRLFSVSFKNEGGIDAGGPYRDAINSIVAEAHSSALSLLLLCPNGRHRIGENNEKYA